MYGVGEFPKNDVVLLGVRGVSFVDLDGKPVEINSEKTLFGESRNSCELYSP